MFLKSIVAALFFFKALAFADPIILTRTNGSTQGVAFGTCNPTFNQDSQLTSVQFNVGSSCLIFDDIACLSSFVDTLEPIMFAAGTNIRKNDANQLVAHYFTCLPGQ